MVGVKAQSRSARAVLDVVIDLLEAHGYEAVRIREVAFRARVSMRTIYQVFGNREELIIAAVHQWMEANLTTTIQSIEPIPGEPIDVGLRRLFRGVFEPWERHPHLLVASYLAAKNPEGKELVTFGKHLAQPAIRVFLHGFDTAYVRDVGEILYNVVNGLLAQLCDGDIEVTELLPAIERTIDRLTAPYVAQRQTTAGRSAAASEVASRPA